MEYYCLLLAPSSLFARTDRTDGRTLLYSAEASHTSTLLRSSIISYGCVCVCVCVAVVAEQERESVSTLKEERNKRRR